LISLDTVFDGSYDNRQNLIEDKNLAANLQFKAQGDGYRHLLVDGWKKAQPPSVENCSDVLNVTVKEKRSSGSRYEHDSD
jgi:hypothetical protein